MKQETFEIEAEYEGERLDKYLSVIFEQSKTSSNAPSRSFFQKLIRDGHVKVNDSIAKANYRLRMDDLVCVEIPDAVETPILPEDIPLDILYEDDDLLVVNKPKGMVVHPSAGHYSGTLVNAIMFHCKDSLSGINGEIRPGIVHRIDMDTTGSLKTMKERSMLRSADIRPTGKRWRSTRKMESRRSHIIKYWNVFRIIPIWNLN